MNRIFAEKLMPGDEVRVIAPSRSLSIISQELRDTARKRFEELGLKLSFGQHVEEIDDFNSSSIESRIQDLHDAFLDTNVKGVITVIGGYNSNQLLREIDWSIIEANPKVFCGFSDITTLSNAMLAKAGLVTYSGVHYSTFGMKEQFEYSYEYFKRCIMQNDPVQVHPSEVWTDDAWFLNQDDRRPIRNEGWLVLNEGNASGMLIGGNLCTLNLLQGTEYMPNLDGAILFIEDDEESAAANFDRDLVSLIQQPGFERVKGIVIGRFQNASKITNSLLTKIVASKKELQGIPVIANVDFGHTSPIITFPIGGDVEILVGPEPSITITRH